MFEELVRRTLKIHFVRHSVRCLISCVVSQTTSNKPMSRLWIPISYVNKFRCFVSSCFNALNQNCLSLFVPNLQTTVSWSRELHLFFVCASSTPFETHFSSFHFGCHNEAFFVPSSRYTISIEIHLNKNVQIWRMVCCYLLPLSQLLFFSLFQHDAWWYEKISIYKMFLYI